MFDTGSEGLADMFPGPEFLNRMGFSVKPDVVSEIFGLFSEVKRVVAGGAIPRNAKILDKLTCTNIMPFFNDHDQI